jgi:hypothetical protein
MESRVHHLDSLRLSNQDLTSEQMRIQKENLLASNVDEYLPATYTRVGSNLEEGMVHARAGRD